MIPVKKVSKLRVGVFMGGKSIEREVSFNSGRTICDHLDSTKYEVIPIFQTYLGDIFVLPWHFLHRGKISDFYNRLDLEANKVCWDDLKTLVDFVYIAVHGRFAEDGTIQGFFEVLQIPYLGTKVFGSALGMDKHIQKKILKNSGIEVAKELFLTSFDVKNLKLEDILKKLENEKIKFPCIIKPVHEGSSFGISVVSKKEELLKAIKKASECDPSREQDILIEEKIEGMEFVCVTLKCVTLKKEKDWFSFPITEVIAEKETDFFDYDQKYMPGRATKITPARCSEVDSKKIQKTCLNATKALNFSTMSRIDGFLTKDGKVIIIDPNTLTGMGPATFLFHQAAEVGMSHTQLINYLIETELQQYGLIDVVFRNKEDELKAHKNNKPKVRVAVLLGGNTNEREVSLESGRNVCYKLSPQKYEVIPIFVSDKKELYKLSQRLLIQNSTREISEQTTKDMQIKWADLPKICDFVFIGLHGGIGENGSVQGTLQMLDLPYNGPGVLASSLCMDKFKTSEFLKSQGFDVPESIVLDKKSSSYGSTLPPSLKLRPTRQGERDTKEPLLKNLTFPLILKPHNDGCSSFVQKIKDEKELGEKLDLYFENSKKDKVMLEEFVGGMELTCGVFGNEEIIVLPPSKSLAKKEILSVEEKFLPGAGENLTPAPLPKDTLKLIQDVVKRVYKALGCKGYSRIDCFYQSPNLSKNQKERVVILEVNTLPALTPATCLFHQAAEIGLRPMEFIDEIIELGFENHKKKSLEDISSIKIDSNKEKELRAR